MLLPSLHDINIDNNVKLSWAVSFQKWNHILVAVRIYGKLICGDQSTTQTQLHQTHLESNHFQLPSTAMKVIESCTPFSMKSILKNQQKYDLNKRKEKIPWKILRVHQRFFVPFKFQYFTIHRIAAIHRKIKYAVSQIPDHLFLAGCARERRSRRRQLLLCQQFNSLIGDEHIIDNVFFFSFGFAQFNWNLVFIQFARTVGRHTPSTDWYRCQLINMGEIGFETQSAVAAEDRHQ